MPSAKQICQNTVIGHRTFSREYFECPYRPSTTVGTSTCKKALLLLQIICTPHSWVGPITNKATQSFSIQSC